MTNSTLTRHQLVQGERFTPDARDVHPNVVFLASLMDDFIQIPGTNIRFGLDGIFGLIPLVGDLLTIVIGRFLLSEADRLGVSRWTKARMYGNYVIDMLVGAIPLIGDAFDFAFKAHRRNLRLLQDHLDSHPEIDGMPKRYTFSWPSAIISSLAASVAITLYMLTIPRWFGMEEMDIGLTVAGLAAPEGGPFAQFARLAWHMGNSVIFVLLYAAVLRYLQKQSTLGTGTVFGVVLWLVGPMLLIPMLLSWWGVPADLTNPGIFMLDLGFGWTPGTIDLGAHLIHGIVAGGLYQHNLDNESSESEAQAVGIVSKSQ